jgi:glycosyltransferase involved in cell wall biosynthesis
VVASDIGPHREILQASGPGHRLFPDGSVAGLAEAIRAELADRDAGAVGAAELHRRTQAHYDWDDVVERTLSVYRNTLAR